MNQKRTTLFVAIIVIASFILSACSTPKEAPVVQTARAEAVSIESTQMVATQNAADAAQATEIIRNALGISNTTPTPTTEVAISTPTAEMVNTTPQVAATLGAPRTVDSSLIYLVGGKLINGQGVETVSVTTLDYISAGTPMQMYFSQLVPNGFTSNIAISPTEQICNDGGCSQWLVYQHNGEWTVIEVSRDFNNPVNFSQVSWLQFISGSVKVCIDDDGNSGTWIGDCSGLTAIYTESYSLSEMQSNTDFEPYYAALVGAMDGKPPFNNMIEIKVVFTK